MSTMRSMARYIMKQEMKKKGMTQICKNPKTFNPITGNYSKVKSFFSRHWKEYWFQSHAM